MEEQSRPPVPFRPNVLLKNALAWSVIWLFRVSRRILRMIDGCVGRCIKPTVVYVAGFVVGPWLWLIRKLKIADDEETLVHKKRILARIGIPVCVLVLAGTGYAAKEKSALELYRDSALHSVLVESGYSDTHGRIAKLIVHPFVSTTVYAAESESGNISLAVTDTDPGNPAEPMKSLDPELEEWLAAWAEQRNSRYQFIVEGSVPPPSPDPIQTVRTTYETYTVTSGDTISGIAARYNLLPNSIYESNPGKKHVIKPGDELLIPPIDGIIIEIKDGDTVDAVAKKYNLTRTQISAANPELNLEETMNIGTKIVLPDYGGERSVFTYTEKERQRIAAAQRRRYVPRSTPTTTYVAPKTNTKLLWPVPSRRITQYYRYGHRAIDIGLPVGSAVWASEGGVVIKAGCGYGGCNSGYGIYVIVDHQNGFQTLYAHNSKLNVRVGQRVSRGQQIALSGNTGWSTGPHIHYEVRYGNAKRNPLNYIR